MSDQPLTVGVFEDFQKVFQEFQRKVFDQFTAVDRRFEVLQRNMDARFDEVTGHLDDFTHRLLRLEQESLLVNAALKRLEASAETVQDQLVGFGKRLGRIEKGFDRLMAATSKYALRSDVQDLRVRIADLKARLGALEKRRG
jgi:hypothetical protein